MYCDRRLGGLERLYLQRPSDYMQIPDEIRKCVCFAGLQKANGTISLAGTAFFMARPLDSMPGRMMGYAVTAKHVIEGIRNKGVDSVMLRLNFKGPGATWLRTDLAAWKYHPNDSTVDVAVMRFSMNDQIDHMVIPIALCASRDVIASRKVDIGDEVFLAGLFVPHAGRKHNIPIVRVGNIAAMPHEKVSTKLGDIDAYLIEARSIGGLGGSPVFVNLTGVRNGVLSVGLPQFFLLGLMHGHFDSELLRKDFTEDSVSTETVNMGLGVVVPIEKVMETINQPSIRAVDDQAEGAEKERGFPAMDIAEDPEEFTKEDFEQALKKVGKKLDKAQPKG